MKCIVCRRPLKASASAAASIGPKCLERLRAAGQHAQKPKRVRSFDRRAPAKDERQADWISEGATA